NDLKRKRDENSAPGQNDNDAGKPDRAEDRIKDLSGKLSDKDKELSETKARLADLEFSSSFGPVAQIYPHAKEFEKEIKELVTSKGLSAQAATAAVLAEKGKLVTKEQIQDDQQGNRGFGGSQDTPSLDKGKKNVSEMTQDERLEAMREEERKGNIVLS
ncbi:MAG: hypothetical protein M1275_03265, partial [Patescibacteria group bacterium]|nr:hypothetical protein [Patescibacteria group bacterium]